MEESISWYQRIIVGDAGPLLRVLPTAIGRGVPLMVFSPPYNLGTTTGGGFAMSRRRSDRKQGKWGGAKTESAPNGHYRDDHGVRARGGQGGWKQPHGSGIADGYDGYDDRLPMSVYRAWLADILEAAWHALSEDGAIFFNHKPRILQGELLPVWEYVPESLRPFVRQEIVWARSGGVNFSPAFYLPTSERIMIIARPAWRLKSRGASGVGDVWRIPQERQTWHPAPFPLALVDRILETTAADLVVDPFMGSGTTAKAAQRRGIAWIGFERSADYAARAMEDIAQDGQPCASERMTHTQVSLW